MIHGQSGGMVNVFYKKNLHFPPKSFIENIEWIIQEFIVSIQIIISPN